MSPETPQQASWRLRTPAQEVALLSSMFYNYVGGIASTVPPARPAPACHCLVALTSSRPCTRRCPCPASLCVPCLAVCGTSTTCSSSHATWCRRTSGCVRPPSAHSLFSDTSAFSLTRLRMRCRLAASGRSRLTASRRCARRTRTPAGSWRASGRRLGRRWRRLARSSYRQAHSSYRELKSSCQTIEDGALGSLAAQPLHAIRLPFLGPHWSRSASKNLHQPRVSAGVQACQRLCASSTPQRGGKSSTSSSEAACAARTSSRRLDLCGWRLTCVQPTSTADWSAPTAMQTCGWAPGVSWASAAAALAAHLDVQPVIKCDAEHVPEEGRQPADQCRSHREPLGGVEQPQRAHEGGEEREEEQRVRGKVVEHLRRARVSAVKHGAPHPGVHAQRRVHAPHHFKGAGARAPGAAEAGEPVGVRPQVGQRQGNRGGLLTAQQAHERPLAMVFERRESGSAPLRLHQVHAAVAAVSLRARESAPAPATAHALSRAWQSQRASRRVKSSELGLSSAQEDTQSAPAQPVEAQSVTQPRYAACSSPRLAHACRLAARQNSTSSRRLSQPIWILLHTRRTSRCVGYCLALTDVSPRPRSSQRHGSLTTQLGVRKAKIARARRALIYRGRGLFERVLVETTLAMVLRRQY